MKKILYSLLVLCLHVCLIFTAQSSERDVRILQRATAAGWKPNQYGAFTKDCPTSRDIGKGVRFVPVAHVLESVKRWTNKTLPNQPQRHRQNLNRCAADVSAKSVIDGTADQATQRRFRRPLSQEFVEVFKRLRENRGKQSSMSHIKMVSGKSGGVTTYDQDRPLPRTSYDSSGGFGYRDSAIPNVDQIPRAKRSTVSDTLGQGLQERKDEARTKERSIRHRPLDCLVRVQALQEREPIKKATGRSSRCRPTDRLVRCQERQD